MSKPLPIKEQIAKSLYELEYSKGYWEVMPEGEKVKWYARAAAVQPLYDKLEAEIAKLQEQLASNIQISHEVYDNLKSEKDQAVKAERERIYEIVNDFEAMDGIKFIHKYPSITRQVWSDSETTDILKTLLQSPPEKKE
jgi:hypothetical protein